VTAAASPDAYVAALTGWQKDIVKTLRTAARKARPADEVIKWGNIVYFANGPVAVIRAEEARVLFGFWRGKRLVDLEPKLKPGGKYEMATIEIGEGETLSPAKAARLMTAAIALNKSLGDPTEAAPAKKKPAKAPAAKAAKQKTTKKPAKR
jgi:hypothetical protein